MTLHTNQLLHTFRHQAGATWAIISHLSGHCDDTTLIQSLLPHWDTALHPDEDWRCGSGFNDDALNLASSLIDDLSNTLDIDTPLEQQYHLLPPFLAPFLPTYLASFILSDCPDWVEAWDILIPDPTADDLCAQFHDYLADHWDHIMDTYFSQLSLPLFLQILEFNTTT